jgi:hypothetical protein
MAADLYIHATLATRRYTARRLRVAWANSFGGRWDRNILRNHNAFLKSLKWPRQDAEDAARHWVFKSCDMIWIGEVSWLKADITGDLDTYIPQPVRAVSDAIGERIPTLCPVLADRIMGAVNLPNVTSYRLVDSDDVRAWLDGHMGWHLFTVSH